MTFDLERAAERAPEEHRERLAGMSAQQDGQP
jgi:hypothetical protein